LASHDPLRNIELLALLEESTTSLRHDVRNRIAAVRNLAFFVRRKVSLEVAPTRDPRVIEFLGKIEGEVQRTDELMDDWSVRSQTARVRALARVQIAECLQLAVDCARLPSAVRVELEPLTERLEVEADRESLAFAVRCLIENAAEAMGAGVVGLAAARSRDSCRLTVTDNGPGIAEPARCLERFYSRKPGHLGLGLCMAHRIVTRLGGDLELGAPAIGAEVSLLLPLAADSAIGLQG
jgi:signal transduction histidine kinase